MIKDPIKLDRRQFLVTTGTLSGSVIIAGCGGTNTANPTANQAGDGGGNTNGTSAANPKMGGTFIDAATEDIVTFDPRMNEQTAANTVLPYIFDTLLVVSPNGKKFIPHLAAEQPMKKDDKTIVIKLKKGVKYHDGVELTAEDVAYSINWMLNPKNKSPNRETLQFIDHVEPVSRYKVEFNLKYPFAQFNLSISNINTAILPKHVAEKLGPKKFGRRPVGTGPFSFAEHVSGGHITLDRFENYFLKTPNLAKYKLRIIPKSQVQFVELAAGNIHQASVPHTLFQKAKQETGIAVNTYTGFDYNGLIFNTYHKPLDSLKVRLAMQYLVDYDELLKTAKGSLAERSYGFLSKETNESWNFPWKEWKKKYYPSQNHEKARKLLEEAGYSDGFDKPLQITSLSTKEFKAMCIVLQNELNQIGFDAEVQEVTFGQWISGLNNADFEVTIYGFEGGRTPNDYYYLFRDPRNDPQGSSKDTPGNSTTGYLYRTTPNDSELGQTLQESDRKIRKARKVYDHDKRRELYIDIAEFWQSQYPHIPVYSEENVTALNKKVKNYDPTAYSSRPLCDHWNNAYLPNN